MLQIVFIWAWVVPGLTVDILRSQKRRTKLATNDVNKASVYHSKVLDAAGLFHEEEAAPTYLLIAGKNCWNGKDTDGCSGGTCLGKGYNASSCQESCTDDSQCECIVFQESDGYCCKRYSCSSDASGFTKDWASFDVYLKQTPPTPAPPPTLPPTQAPTLNYLLIEGKNCWKGKDTDGCSGGTCLGKGYNASSCQESCTDDSKCECIVFQESDGYCCKRYSCSSDASGFTRDWASFDVYLKQPPTPAPTYVPTDAPTDVPTDAPTDLPTDVPTEAPSETPTEVPTEAPTHVPTNIPTEAPTEDCSYYNGIVMSGAASYSNNITWRNSSIFGKDPTKLCCHSDCSVCSTKWCWKAFQNDPAQDPTFYSHDVSPAGWTAETIATSVASCCIGKIAEHNTTCGRDGAKAPCVIET